MNYKNSYKFIVTKDNEGNKMLTATCGNTDKLTVDHAKLVSPQEFAKALVTMVKQGKDN